MRMLTERTQVLLSPEQLARLKRLAARRGRSVGAIIREAVEAYTATPAEDRRAAIGRLFAIEAPVDDWDVMKREIVDGRFADLPDSQS